MTRLLTNDRIIQSRCKSETLAIIAEALVNDRKITFETCTTSTLVRIALEWLAQNVVDSSFHSGQMTRDRARNILDRFSMGHIPSKYQVKKLGGFIGDQQRPNSLAEDLKELENNPEAMQALIEQSRREVAAIEAQQQNGETATFDDAQQTTVEDVKRKAKEQVQPTNSKQEN